MNCEGVRNGGRMMIRLNQVSGGYENHIDLIHDVSLHVEKGSFFTLIGPNGSGKSTLLRMISGVLPIRSGEIYLNSQPLSDYSALQRASFLTVLSQEHEVAFDFSVQEIVLLGRYPHQKGWLKTTSAKDNQIVEEAMRTTQVWKYRDQPFHSLSGGEKQRVLLAKSLAQEPKILLLDEPTNHLDIRHMHDMLHLLKTWKKTKHITILAVLHDLNIASLYSDRIGLLHNGRLVKEGEASILRNDQLLERIYGIQTMSQDHPLLPKPQLFLSPKSETSGGLSQRNFQNSYTFYQDERHVRIVFDQPLRTISNAVTVEGIRWFRYFCYFHQAIDMRNGMEELNIPFEQAAGMILAGDLQDYEWLENQEADYSLAVLVTSNLPEGIQISVFIDGHLTDGALVNAMISAAEAKVKALCDANVLDSRTGAMAARTSADGFLIAATQRGQAVSDAKIGTGCLDKLIDRSVYQATRNIIAKAVQSYK